MQGLLKRGEQNSGVKTAYAGPKWHWWVEGASHYNVRQRDREEYLRRLRGFLGECLRPEADAAAHLVRQDW